MRSVSAVVVHDGLTARRDNIDELRSLRKQMRSELLQWSGQRIRDAGRTYGAIGEQRSHCASSLDSHEQLISFSLR